MIHREDKKQNRAIRAKRVRTKVSGTSLRPRLSVNRSLSNVSAQIIDDTLGTTLVSATTLEKALVKELEGKTKQEKAFIIGQTIGKRAIEKGIKTVVFDRAGYIYTGAIAKLAEGARDAGLEF